MPFYPVAIPFPVPSKTQVTAIEKQIPRARWQLCAVFTMMWQGSDDAPLPCLKGRPCAKLADQELLVGCLVASQHLVADGREGDKPAGAGERPARAVASTGE